MPGIFMMFKCALKLKITDCYESVTSDEEDGLKQLRIAFLGTGLMGQPMVARLLAAGFAVTVWNRTPSKTAACVARGAVLAADVGSAVKQADVIVTMLADGWVVADVLNAAAVHIPLQALVIDMSSTGQAEAQQMAAMLTLHGIAFMDAPVSGGVIGAQQGTLAIMAGASVEDFARALPVLSVLGTATRVGDPGCGQLAKLCNQLIVGGTLHLVAEALLLAQAGGADPAAVRAALRGGFADSRILEVHGQRMLERNFMPGGQVQSQAKDMQNILTAAQQHGLQLPQAELIAQVYQRLLARYPQADQSAALLDLELHNPTVRLTQLADQLPLKNGM